MRRGFKSWCERTATEYRNSLGIPITAALDPRILAGQLDVQVLMPEEVLGLSAESLTQLTVTDQDSWSAVTISQRGVRLVILNSGHPETRQANSLAHELAHIILNHTTEDARVSLEGFLFRSKFDEEQEKEADWLSGCLLVPREGLFHAYCLTPSVAVMATHFRVSKALVNWRLRATGIARQSKHALAGQTDRSCEASSRLS